MLLIFNRYTRALGCMSQQGICSFEVYIRLGRMFYFSAYSKGHGSKMFSKGDVFLREMFLRDVRGRA